MDLVLACNILTPKIVPEQQKRLLIVNFSASTKTWSYSNSAIHESSSSLLQQTRRTRASTLSAPKPSPYASNNTGILIAKLRSNSGPLMSPSSDVESINNSSNSRGRGWWWWSSSDKNMNGKSKIMANSNSSVQSSSTSNNNQEFRSNSSRIRNRNRMLGTLFKYGNNGNQEIAGGLIGLTVGQDIAFQTGDFKQQVIFIGGLTDGFLATEYLEPLSEELEAENWSLVQVLLSSSHTGYGTSSLKRDATEIDQLISYLINKEGSEGVVLLGHSTGCQDIVYYLKSNLSCSRAVRGAILQAPVSDREFRATVPETATMIDLASSMIKEGKAMELMPREANPDAPITAYRYHSLCAYMGDDDMFSSDLTDDQLRQKLGHMSKTPCQVIFSMDDEYVPKYVDKRSLVERLCKAMGGAEKVEIEWGNHSLSNRAQEAVDAIMDFVKREGPKGWDDPWK